MRIVVLVATFLVGFCGQFVVGMVVYEDNHERLGTVLSYAAWITLLAVVFLGPAWVLHAPPSPQDDGPPRGGIVPFPAPTPRAEERADRDRSDRAARSGFGKPRAVVGVRTS